MAITDRIEVNPTVMSGKPSSAGRVSGLSSSLENLVNVRRSKTCSTPTLVSHVKIFKQPSVTPPINLGEIIIERLMSFFRKCFQIRALRPCHGFKPPRQGAWLILCAVQPV